MSDWEKDIVYPGVPRDVLRLGGAGGDLGWWATQLRFSGCARLGDVFPKGDVALIMSEWPEAPLGLCKFLGVRVGYPNE